MKRAVALLIAVACLAGWVVLAFVMAVPSGWVHVPLAAGACVVAYAIILSPPANAEPKGPRTRKT